MAKIITEEMAARMSPIEALRTLATAAGVPEAMRRDAQAKLDAMKLIPKPRKPMAHAVGSAMHQAENDAREEQVVALEDMRRLGGNGLMAGFWYPPDDHAMEPQTFQGSGHSVSSEPPPECPAERVRQVAEEVARKPMPRAPIRRIGF
jgi:hypothetical protein